MSFNGWAFYFDLTRNCVPKKKLECNVLPSLPQLILIVCMYTHCLEKNQLPGIYLRFSRAAVQL